MAIRSLRHILPSKWSQIIFPSCLLIIIIFNIVNLRKEVDRLLGFRKYILYQNIGNKFEGLNIFIKNAPFIGYYSDMDLSEKESGKLFAHAQFVLAPTVLDLNNLDHEYVLFVCSSEKIAWKKMIEIGAEPLRRNKFGMILARKKNP